MFVQDTQQFYIPLLDDRIVTIYQRMFYTRVMKPKLALRDEGCNLWGVQIGPGARVCISTINNERLTESFQGSYHTFTFSAKRVDDGCGILYKYTI